MHEKSSAKPVKRMSKRNQSFMEGALILTVGTILVKIIGAIFKIPLGNVIGETGNGYFNTAYSIYLPIYVLATAGFPSAIARLVSENAALNRYKDVRKIKNSVTRVLVLAGILGFLAMIVGGFIFVNLLDKKEAIYSILAMSPSIFFCCVMSIYRGYYEGLRNMVPTAISQVIEALGKLFLGLGMAVAVVEYAKYQFNKTGMFMGNAYDSVDAAKYASYPFASAAAILGITLGSLFGMIYLMRRYRTVGDGITEREWRKSPPSRDSKTILRRIYRIGVPIALGVLVMNITQLIDTFTIQTRLASIDESYLRTMYDGLITENVHEGDVPIFLFGAYGFALNLFNLVPTITQALGISALPALSAAWASKNKKSVQKSINAVMKITIFIAVPCGLGLFALADPILQLLYPGKPGAIVAAPLLRTLGIAVLFNAFLSPVNSMLQAVGKQDVPVKLMLFGASIKLVMNFTLVGIPSININGAPWGTLACYSFIVICSVFVLMRSTKSRVNFIAVVLKPLIAGILCAVSAYVSCSLFSSVISDKISTVLAIIIAGVVYVAVLFLVKGITKEDILMIPKGEKIAKRLEKFGLIG